MDAGLSSKTSTATDWHDQMRTIVGPAHLRSTEPQDGLCWLAPSFLIEPGSEQELSAALKCANENGLAVIPRGGGTKLDWGNPPTRADLFLSTARLTRLLEHAWSDLTVSVEAGCTIEKLQTTLAKHGQRIALDASWPDRATVGGLLSTNDSGALRLRFGSLRDLIIGVTLALPDGTLASSGGKVVKNVAGYDLPKLATGALGTLGVITRAVFRLHPVPTFSQTLTIRTQNFEEAQRVVLGIQGSKLAHVALQTRLAANANPEIDIQFEGTTPGLIAQRSNLEDIVAPLATLEPAANPWGARQQLFAARTQADDFAVAKLSALPASVASTAETIARAAAGSSLQWTAVIQAMGIGCLRLDGAADKIFAALQSLRLAVEKDHGSLVVLRRPPAMLTFDAWGCAGDSLDLMRAVKLQLDPRGTLNPGRFVGGI